MELLRCNSFCVTHLTGYSAEAAPLVPMLKLSMKRTAFSSSGTRVPPDYKTELILRLTHFPDIFRSRLANLVLSPEMAKTT